LTTVRRGLSEVGWNTEPGLEEMEPVVPSRMIWHKSLVRCDAHVLSRYAARS